jgi:hypothetical protein
VAGATIWPRGARRRLWYQRAMFEIPPEKEELVAKILENAWVLALGGLLALIGFVLLLMKFAPAPLGG